ncbi:MAG: ATP-binding protein [Ferruginibacter sp.]
MVFLILISGLNKTQLSLLSFQRQQIQDVNGLIKVEKLPSLFTYRTPLKQVFQNLISNSLKYHRDGVRPQICISVSNAGEFWQFAISDNGIGIGEEYFDKIFIIFQRLHKIEKFSGTGIGLSITKKIIESMGGSMWVQSEVAKGSTFYVTILKNTGQ